MNVLHHININIKQMKNDITIKFAIIVLGTILFYSCGFKTVEEAGIKYATKPAFELPGNIDWKQIGTAKELVNVKENLVVISGGKNAIPKETWDEFKVRLPWQKNIERNLLFDKTYFLRSPNAPSDCQGAACKTNIDYKGYTWTALASPLAVDFIPSKTNLLKPDEGHLVVKVIKKCQAIVFENEIYQMSDNKGNLYAMHATETGKPNLNVVLPEGFTIQKVVLEEPLVIVPFGDKEDCYLNVVGDHLGQGYHQYQYASDFYPSK